MEKFTCDGIVLEYETRGHGEPVLLIAPVVSAAFAPFLSAPELCGPHRLIRYDKRGWGGSTHASAPVCIADHARDAARLLEHLGIAKAHVAGHSSGGAVALQLALDRPELVHSLALLEPSLLDVPAAAGLFERAAPALEAFAGGDHARAVIGFLSVVGGLDSATCRIVIDANVPGGVAQAIDDAETFFGVELPALGAWRFDEAQAARIRQPVLSVLGSDTQPLWIEVAQRLRAWIPQVEEHVVPGVGHLLQMQRPAPVAAAVAAFLARHPMREPATISG